MRGTWTILLLLPVCCVAQDGRFNAFCDFHIHTSFKHYYRDIKSVDDIMSHRFDTAYLKQTYGTLNWQQFAKKKSARDSGNVSTCKNYDQSNFYNLRNASGSILCTSLYPYEKQFATNWLKRFISNRFVSGIPRKRLKEIGSDASYPLKEFLAEYTFLSMQNVQDPPAFGVKIELAKNGADLRRILSDEKAIAQVISIEGGQVLYGPIAGKRANVRKAYVEDSAYREILSNIDTLRMLPHKVFFITPSHFTDNAIAGFCKTIDRPGLIRWLLKRISTSGAVRKSFFTKFGEGIHGELDLGRYDRQDCDEFNVRNVRMPYTNNPYFSHLGKDVYRQLLRPDDSVSKRILIDVKHMDIQARFEYYDLVKELNKTSSKRIPIIAGHVAVSGETLPVAMATGLNPLFDRYEEVENPAAFYKAQTAKYNADWKCRTLHLKPEDRSKFFFDKSTVEESFNPFTVMKIDAEVTGWFYPWSINLCNEEIKIIYDSDGIIGLNFDERILGGKMLRYSLRYQKYIKKRFDSLKNSNFIFQTSLLSELRFRDYYKCEPLLRNILYIVMYSGREDPTAWQHIAIGSDFDGLIDPIDLCPTADKIGEFRKQLTAYLEVFWTLHKDDAMFQKRDLFFNGAISFSSAVDKLFFENGRNFILNNF